MPDFLEQIIARVATLPRPLMWLSAAVGLYYLLMGIGGLWWLVWGNKSEEERAAAELAAIRKDFEKKERARRDDIHKLARQLLKQIVENITRQGLARAEQKKGAVTFYSKIKVDAAVCTDDAIYYRVSERTPFGITFTDIAQPEVETNLSAAIRRPCRIRISTDYGLWIIVGLASGVADIPRVFPYYSKETAKNALDLLPHTKPYLIPIGVGENMSFKYADIRKLIHVLIAGTTGGGKSTFLNQSLISLMLRNHPKTLKLALIDLKGGLEMISYESVPHLMNDVIFKPDEVPPLLERFREEKERRFNLFRSRKVKNLQGWNQTQREKLPVWLLVFDEIQALMIKPTLRQTVEGLLGDLAFQGRAVGLYIWICTQFPNKDVLSTAIRANCPTKVCFAMTLTGSMLVLDGTEAAKLPLEGRAVFSPPGRDLAVVQTPYLGRLKADGRVNEKEENRMVQNYIKEIVAKWSKPDESNSDKMLLLFEALISDYRGKCAMRTATELGIVGVRELKDRIGEFDYNLDTQKPVIELPEMGRYILVRIPKLGGSTRWLVPVGQKQLPKTKEEILSLYQKAYVTNDLDEDLEEQSEEELESDDGLFLELPEVEDDTAFLESVSLHDESENIEEGLPEIESEEI